MSAKRRPFTSEAARRNMGVGAFHSFHSHASALANRDALADVQTR